ncbi:MAG: sulfur carrier protein ThiS [Actinobacteria bacterium]|nr:sulfur carrier protein ThiS [Actinomycetota bacterium]
MAIKVFINGKPSEAAAPVALLDLLAELKIRPEVISVAVNKSMVGRADLEGLTLDDGDELEIMLHLAGGRL